MVRLAQRTVCPCTLQISIIKPKAIDMAQSKQKAAPAKKKNAKAQGVVAMLKRAVTRKPKAARPAVAKPKASRAKTASPKPRAAKTKTAPTPAPAPTPVAAPPAKRKPPSITITRPEVTRPPLVQMPTPKNEPPVGAPNILAPKGSLPVPSLTPSFRWMYVGGATRYEVEWSHDTHFGRGHGNSIVSAQTLFTLDATHALRPGQMYHWRVRGGNDSGWGPWSSAESFKAPDKV